MAETTQHLSGVPFLACHRELLLKLYGEHTYNREKAAADLAKFAGTSELLLKQIREFDEVAGYVERNPPAAEWHYNWHLGDRFYYEDFAPLAEAAERKSRKAKRV